MKQLNFLMGLHCHQPVDNFGNIFEDAYRKSYEPFLSVLERHPKIKLSLHYSGSLLDWIAREKPAFLERIKALIKKRQVEIMGGGHFEPILTMVPAEDARGQIVMLTRSVKERLGFDSSGIWLAERVWDPGIRPVFKDLGIKYTVLDDFHLRRSGVKDTEVFGRYSVKGLEDFSVFASIKKLRYTMPFRSPDITLNFLEELHLKNPRAECVTFADDCEKFGFWPHTYDWVYKKGWLEKFFTMLEEADWIKTMTFSEALGECPTAGEIEIPHSSYAEMDGWCGGDFNNFFRKYPESDLMRKRMLHVSRKVSRFSDENAKKELYKAQSNCAYWHGVFGGFYTNFLRQGVYRHMIKAENALAGENTGNKIEMVKFEESADMICAQNEFLALYVDPNCAGSIFEIDYKPFPYNLLNTVSRRYEPYHEKLKPRRALAAGEIKKKVDRDEAVDLYEILGVREPNLKRFLNYDSYRKSSSICHVMDLKTSLSDFIRSKHRSERHEGLSGAYDCALESKRDRSEINLRRESGALRLNKCIILERGADIFMKFTLENVSNRRLKFIFGIEFNWSVEDARFMRNGRTNRLRKIELTDKVSGIRIEHTFATPVNLWSFPVYTLNESDRGLGKTFQEISLLFNRKLTLEPNAKFSLEAGIRISR